MKDKNIVVLPGDGIGREVMDQAVKILKRIENKTEYVFNLEFRDAGQTAIDKYGKPIEEETLEASKKADCVLLGAVGNANPGKETNKYKPEDALLALRKTMGVYCNIRPIKRFYKQTGDAGSKDIDMIIIRELTGGIYFGKPSEISTDHGKRWAVSTMRYNEEEIARIALKSFEFALKRTKRITSVDKANVLKVSQLWREVVTEVSQEYPDVSVNHMLVDNCAMQLIKAPEQFDVILTSNMFGDILSDEASMLTGSLGMLPSASIGDGPGLYEPVHGTAPDIAGQNIANPVAMIGSVAMMFRYSFDDERTAGIIEDAVATVLEKGFHTPDLSHEMEDMVIGTDEMGSLILEEISGRIGIGESVPS